MKRKPYTIVSIYDTETCNIGVGENTRAFPILFIDNDIRDVDIYNYTPEIDDNISFFRYEDEMLNRIDEYVEWGIIMGVIPITCAYNLMFDLQPLMERLNSRYEIKANAQSSTNVYTLDLYIGDEQVFRFWDTYHLEMRGLAAMGETAGLKKAKGDWDYSLIRTPETPLTELELFYAARDVQVIPSYLRYLLHANEWMKQSDLGFRVLTKTSIVRQMARNEIERLVIPKKNGKKLELRYAFMQLCKKEMPHDYIRYALRKACFRGGFTFTSAAFALTLQRNVVSADVTSMHHTFINGRYIPQDFKVCYPKDLMVHFKHVLNTKLEYILDHYEKPFDCAFHARIRFINIRLKKNTCFSEWGIALESASKFKKSVSIGTEYGLDPRNIAQENSIRASGWHDSFEKAEFAFGKLYSSDEIILHLNELELWCLSRVYEWDSIEPIFGEATVRFKLPPDYVTLQSNKLFKQKQVAKIISLTYKKGIAFTGDCSGIPDGITTGLREGTLEPEFFNQWYSSTVKGMFNGIYGTMAQDVFKPQYKCDNGELVVDTDTITTEDNFQERKPKNTRVLYTYGMRIVGGSRMHMIIALEMLYNYFGNRVRVLGGDTDSMKIACDSSVLDSEIENALEPIAVASKMAITRCMKRVRINFPDLASGLNGIGGFEIENAGKHYKLHYELWNKARISWDGKKTHITCAGLPRPIGLYTIETFMDDLIRAGYNPEEVIQKTVGFDTYVSYDISHTLEHHKPKATDIYEGEVIDYTGATSHVFAHQSISLYSSPRWLGETAKISNRFSVEYLERQYGRTWDGTCTYLERSEKDGRAILAKDTSNGIKIIMEGISL